MQNPPSALEMFLKEAQVLIDRGDLVGLQALCGEPTDEYEAAERARRAGCYGEWAALEGGLTTLAYGLGLLDLGFAGTLIPADKPPLGAHDLYLQVLSRATDLLIAEQAAT
jgi:hypothetical protein